MTCLRLPEQIGDLGEFRLVHQQVIGEAWRDGREAQFASWWLGA